MCFGESRDRPDPGIGVSEYEGELQWHQEIVSIRQKQLMKKPGAVVCKKIWGATIDMDM